MADSKAEKDARSADQAREQAAKDAPTGPSQSADPNLPDGPDLDPTKVVGTYAMQPDPNDERPAPLPNVPKGVNEAPADDADDAGVIGEHGGTQ